MIWKHSILCALALEETTVNYLTYDKIQYPIIKQQKVYKDLRLAIDILLCNFHCS